MHVASCSCRTVCVAVRGQLAGVSFLSSPSGTQELFMYVPSGTFAGWAISVALKPSCFKTGAVDLGKNTVPTKKEKLECPYRDRIWYAILFWWTNNIKEKDRIMPSSDRVWLPLNTQRNRNDPVLHRFWGWKRRNHSLRQQCEKFKLERANGVLVRLVNTGRDLMV